MKLDLLKEIASAVSLELSNDGLTTVCYHNFEDKWHSTAGTSLTLTSNVISALNKSILEAISYHAPKSREAWFHFSELGATLSITFPSSPRLETRTKTRARIEIIRTNATNAFRVSHNELTELLSRDTFRQKIKLAIAEISTKSPKGFVLASEGRPLKTVSVLAFDIDKFKQVNDTHGHLYGDQVLKTFARRLEHTAERLMAEYGPEVEITLGHPSGEEFLALVKGPLSNDDLTQIADSFRLCIADEPLPSDKEWQQLVAAPELAKVPFPVKADRLVTTSVGIASHTAGIKSDDSATLVLLDKADIALYKSKSGGRNRVTLFDDIIRRCGTVLEHDSVTGVIAIDIGQKVGVNVGQEFRVFPTTYSGTVAYTIDDGRSRKTLGYYPKIELCRIVVFDSQSDISFAYISSPSSITSAIENGSVLEAVPLGTITHLIERPSGGVSVGNGFSQQKPDVFGGVELQDRVNQLVDAKKSPVAFVLRLKFENDFYKKYGSAALNRALAQLFSRVRERYSDGYLVGLIDTTAICVVGSSDTFNKAELEEFLTSNYPSGDELEPICGCYYSEPDAAVEGGGGTPSIEKHAVELARYALSYTAGFKENRVQLFSTTVAEGIISEHRNIRSYSAGIADFINLRKIGIESADLENYGGLCYSALGENRLAFECYLRATDLSPDNIIFRGNAAILAIRTQELSQGLNLVLNADRDRLLRSDKVHPNALWSYAVLLAKAHDTESSLFDAALMKELGSAALNLPDAASRGEYDLVKNTVATISL